MLQPSFTRPTGILSPYRWGEYKWEDYLLDTQALIYQSARANVAAVDGLADRVQSTGSVFEQMMTQADARQVEFLGAFHDFAAEAGASWSKINAQLESLCDITSSGFDLLDGHLRQTNALLQAISARLDRIVHALEHPLAIQAHELFCQGRYALDRGLYREALADLQAAEEKRPINPVLHVHLAQLHYHVHDREIPFDLDRADHHIRLAMRYVRALAPDLGAEKEGTIDLVFRTAAHIAFIRSGEHHRVNAEREAAAELSRARAFLDEIAIPSAHTRLLRARIAGAAGDYTAVVAEIAQMVDFNRAWLGIALSTRELRGCETEIGSLQRDLEDNPGIHSTRFNDAARAAHRVASELTFLGSVSRAQAVALKSTVDGVAVEFRAGAVDASSGVDKLCDEVDAAVMRVLHSVRELHAQASLSESRHRSEAERSLAMAKEEVDSHNVGCGLYIVTAVLAFVVGEFSESPSNLWFVLIPGLPLSYLLHHLIAGSSKKADSARARRMEAACREAAETFHAQQTALVGIQHSFSEEAKALRGVSDVGLALPKT